MIRQASAVLAALAACAALADDASGPERGRALFTGAIPACATCHALQAAGAEGAIGPSLDELRPDAARIERAVRDGIGAMPAYRDVLSDEDIRALAQFVAGASGGD